MQKKDKAKMEHQGLKTVNPLIKAAEEHKARQKLRREDREVDEGIIDDLEEITSEGEGVDIEPGEIEDEEESTPAQEGNAAKTDDEEHDTFVTPKEAHATIKLLFEKEREIFELVYGSSKSKKTAPPSVDLFFIQFILVPPSKYRPATPSKDSVAEPGDNTLYKGIMTACESMNQINNEIRGAGIEAGRRRRDFRDFQNAWVRLQDAVNSLIDRDRNPVQGAAGKMNPEGIKQKLEKKEGLFRKNMMGKRVNFAARSVISPDPYIESNEIGVPPVFAEKLTFAEPVTSHNFFELRQAVINGAQWPGAAAVENENGQVISLRTKNLEERQALANMLQAPSNTGINGARNKKVHRHLNNGDVVLMNRQPTLHKPSFMVSKFLCSFFPFRAFTMSKACLGSQKGLSGPVFHLRCLTS